MCDPATASLAVQGIGGVTSAFGAMKSASVQKMGLKLDATIARINAEKMRDNAREMLRQGNEAETRQRLATAQVKSRQRAAMGANNVDMTTGSALNRLISTDYMGEADAQTIRLNAARAAAGMRADATSYDMRGSMAAASARGINPMLTGLTSLLGSATSIASSWYGMKEAGAFGNGKTVTGGGSGMISVNNDALTRAGESAFRYGTF